MRSLLLAAACLALACGTPLPSGDGGTGGGSPGGGAGGGAAGGGSGGTGGAGGGAAGGAGGGAADAGVRTTVRVHYPAKTRTLWIRGALAPLSWNQGVRMLAGADDTWTWEVTDLAAPLELKPLLDDTTWSKGPNYTVRPGEAVDLYPRFLTDQGSWSRRWPSFASTVLGNTRGVWVYTPPSYDENPWARFPVLYMFDGQNLFDPASAFGGNPWRVQDALDQGAADGTIREAIVVGPESTASRIAELTPTSDPSYGGGRGDLTLRFLEEELKPKVDQDFRTKPGREHTVLVGSSLGGLMSSYGGLKKPAVFGFIGAMSPSTWWDNEVIVGLVRATPAAPARPLKVYVDVGDNNDGLAETLHLVQAYRDAGYVDGQDFLYVMQPGASHNETYWRQRLPGALRFLLGPRSP